MTEPFRDKSQVVSGTNGYIFKIPFQCIHIYSA